ncbi:uncharacterized protein LOC131606012 [Vicia villosa]|uniref:uncharacterized protein LOC131606012 n=1 Tax=Vicia villosa TaxID=3911 RepID=UPI00273BCC0C|nr:uncharacterized protein LOC131606012 [Vicia villosa]
MKDGTDIPFWYACWSGNQSLMEAYPDLYRYAKNHLTDIFSAGLLSYGAADSVSSTDADGIWQWQLHNMVEMCRGEDTELTDSGDTELTDSGGDAVSVQQRHTLIAGLLSDLQQQGVRVYGDGEDTFVWSAEACGVFTVSSCYNRFRKNLSGPPIDNITVVALSHLWKVNAPPKILLFGWRFIINKIATKDLLVKRGIILDGDDSRCVFCAKENESLRHLFAHCEVTNRVWRKVFDWVGVDICLSREEFVNYFHYCGKITCVKTRIIGAVVWLSTVWNIWLSRNAIVFKNETFSFLGCWSEIVCNAWRWLSSFYNRVNYCNLYTWNILPFSCFET